MGNDKDFIIADEQRIVDEAIKARDKEVNDEPTLGELAG